MIVAAYLGTGYKIMLFIHVLAMLVAFAPAFVWPFVTMALRKSGDQDPAGTVNRLAGGNSQRIYGPALAVGGLVGFGVAGMSKPASGADPIFAMSQTWLIVAALVWFLMLGIFFGLLAPAEKKFAEGDRSVAKMISMGYGIVHLLVVIALYLMVFKPGGPNV